MAAADTTAVSYFAGLLEQSRKLREETEAADLPPIQLGLGEIERRAKEIRKSTPAAQSDTRAHYLLAAGGVNRDEALKILESIETQGVIESAGVPLDTDIESYLRARKEQNILSSIEDGMERTARDFDSFVAKNVTMEWDEQKKKIFQHFGLMPMEGAANTGANGGAPSTFSPSGFGPPVSTIKLGKPSGLGASKIWTKSMGSSILGRPSGPVARSFSFADVDPAKQITISRSLQLRQQKYAMVVRQLNEARIAGPNFSVIRALGNSTKDDHMDVLTTQLYDSWSILESVTGEPNDTDLFQSHTRICEREFAGVYLLAKPDSQQAVQLRKIIEAGSRRYLEKLFYRHVEETINRNPQQAQLGGVPSMINKFKAFFNVRSAVSKWDDKHFDRSSDGTPIWAITFYTIRAGFVQEGAAYVKENLQYFQKQDRHFNLYISAYAKDANRRLPPQLQNHIQMDYAHLIRDAENVDMFRIACYKVIGRCDLVKRTLTDVLPTAEDWMWLQLVLVREPDRGDEPANEVFTLADLQKSVLQFGARHFSQKGSNVGLYFQMLLMSGLFEHAVHYLYTFQAADAVHFAIALTYYGLLGISSPAAQRSDSNLLTTTTDGRHRIDFARMIGQYVRDLRPADIEIAIDYLCLICLNGDLPPPEGPIQLALCHEALREIVLESREFTKLLGDVKADGRRERGAIDRRMKLIKITDEQEFLRTITEHAAIQADEDGRFQDSVLLYHLTEDYDTVIQVINRNLSDWVTSEDPIQGSQKTRELPLQEQASQSLTSIEDPRMLAMHMLKLYSANATMYSKISARNREACIVLVRIAEGKISFYEGKYDTCLQQIEEIDVVPIETKVEVGAIRTRAQNFGSLHETVARAVGMLLKLAVECCSRLAAQLKESPYMDPTKRQMLSDVRNRVKCAMIYAGMVQYKLPANVYEFIAARDEQM